MVDATLVFKDQTDPVNARYCSAVTFVKWRENPRAIAWEVRYKFQDDGINYKLPAKPPFDDYWRAAPGRAFDVPAGNHWLAISVAGVDASGVADCSGMAQTMRESYHSAKIRMTVTTKPRTKCDKAKLRIARAKRLIAFWESDPDPDDETFEEVATAEQELLSARAQKKRDCPDVPKVTKPTKVRATPQVDKTQLQKGDTISVEIGVKARETVIAKASGSVLVPKVTRPNGASLSTKKVKVSPGRTGLIRLRLKGRSARDILEALDQGRKATAKVKVTLRDEVDHTKRVGFHVRLITVPSEP